uniref:protein phosphatase 1 regulatory subunit 7 isoform X5 n=1 Tax=Halichoerus grypus TaxID=9711 RepID=UPI0016595B02|nr:protein phosphatase 1 regulatory subunit 7 isoform X5 [Halichoerus grypus]
MDEVDRRVESEESGDEEGKKQSSGIVADLSEHSLKDGEAQGEEDPEGTRPKGQELPVDMETINLDRDAEDVDLNHYRIGKIEGFEVLKKVKTLCLRQNLIKCIENLEELQSLRELDLYDNQIKKIENLEALTQLEILDISFNLLRNIEGVEKLTQLKKLFLVNNKISKIENISNLHQLQMLELGSNRIRAIENIDTLTSLESLFLGKNKITKLQNLDALTNLTVLSMQSNRLTKMEGLQSLVNLRELYLSHNGIEVIEGLENNVYGRDHPRAHWDAHEARAVFPLPAKACGAGAPRCGQPRDLRGRVHCAVRSGTTAFPQVSQPAEGGRCRWLSLPPRPAHCTSCPTAFQTTGAMGPQL